MDLTENERRVLDGLRAIVSTSGCVPSLRELAKATGFKSTTSISIYLRALERKGVIARDPGRHRAIRIAPEAT